MLRKMFLAPAILGLAVTLFAADTAWAQGRGARGYRGGYSGYRYGGYRGGVYIGLGAPWYGYGYGYRPYYYDNYYYASPSYAYTTPTYNYDSYYYQPSTVYVPSAPATTTLSSTANIRVMLPDSQAQVWFDGALTSQAGTDRLFTTPALASSGTYRIRAAWNQAGRQMTQERVVTVNPGQNVVIDFTQPMAEQIPAPRGS